MNCENYLCVYEKDGKCIFEEIELDINGMCTSCIYPAIDIETLRILKEKTIESMEIY